jgi:hypothetical protein
MQRRAYLVTRKVGGVEGGIRRVAAQFLWPAGSARTSLAKRRRFNRAMVLAIAAPLLFAGAFPLPACATSYSTNFPSAEPLISEGGHWITAGTPGVDWHATLAGFKGDRHISSVSTTPDYAFGPVGPAHFGDALALLTGNWEPDQMAQATVRQVSPTGYPEVEIRLRTSPQDATGYEIMWSALGKSGAPYLAIATWNGPASAPPHWTFLKELHGPDYGVATGDVVKGMIVGNTITAYKNGKLQFRITDNTFARGNPGFGFNEGPNGTYGISSFNASDGVSDSPSEVTNYTTNFPSAEPLISENGHWITAGTPGVHWYATMCGGKGDQHISSVSTTPGYAFGPVGPARFGDALALLTGTWNPDQTAWATVREISPSDHPEVEIRLRTSPQDATGYEIMWSAIGKAGTPYLAIATWNGPSSPPPHYTILKDLHGPDYGVATGDVIKGTIVGNTITAYKNGKLQFQIKDNTFSKGNPGFGFNEGPSGTYGISSFAASGVPSGTEGAALEPGSINMQARSERVGTVISPAANDGQGQLLSEYHATMPYKSNPQQRSHQ